MLTPLFRIVMTLPLLVILCLPVFAQTQAVRSTKELQQQLIHSVLQDEILKVEGLLKRGADPNARVEFAKEDAWWHDNREDVDKAPPLFVLACRFVSIRGPRIIEMLLERGADVNIADKNGVTPLMAASPLGGSVSLLLERGAKVNALDKSGKTPLMYAMNNRGIGTASRLLDKGANINAQDKEGRTALMYAITDAVYDPINLISDDREKKAREAKARYSELIRFLLERGADARLRDKDGDTALDIAKSHGQPEIVRLIETHLAPK